jgi:hypothetical protein
MVPALAGVTAQDVAGSTMLQVALPSLTMMLPLGVPVAGVVAVTVACTVIGWPTTLGFGVCALMLVDVEFCGRQADPVPA